jgi:hypothetical protein
MKYSLCDIPTIPMSPSLQASSEWLFSDTFPAPGIAASLHEKNARFKQFLDQHKNTDAYQSLLDEVHREGSRKWQQCAHESRARSSADQRAYTVPRKVARQRPAKAKESLTITSRRTHSTLGSVSGRLDNTGTDV